ncbi:MATE family efflux transporter [Candidatus Phytoplasma pruni]|uniref:MATE family efflux transporter n=1 Tax=Candidatus Phytoplasma pruni TaxID=479893 RepID=A0A851HGI1_9MOLU|nr:MATE family efflux transporter [Candidatus Phytoplasma pruni]NWN45740.1 MATE family efflux transporter [Candidatus Phytoplasma pruni]
MSKQEIRSNKKQLKQKAKQKLFLEGNLFKVLLMLVIPIALTNIAFQVIPKNIDLFMADKPDGSEKFTDSLAIISSVQNMFSFMGLSLATAGIVVIGKEYAKKNYKTAQKMIKTTLFSIIGITFGIALIAVIIGSPILHKVLSGMEEDVFKTVRKYYIFLIISGVLMAVNTVLLGLERVKGNIKTIYLSNALFVIFKVSINFLFVYIGKKDPYWLGVSTALSSFLVTIFLVVLFVISLKRDQGELTDSEEVDNTKTNILKNILKLALPILGGRLIYESGRLIVLIIGWKIYPSGSLSAVQIGDGIAAIGLNFGFALEEAQLSIISANLANKNLKRAFETIKKTLLLNMILGFVFTVIFGFFGQELYFLIKGCKPEYRLEGTKQYQFQLGIMIASISGFYTVVTQGIMIRSMIPFKKPRIDMFFALLRVFLRISFIIVLGYWELSPWNKYENANKSWQGYHFANLTANTILLFSVTYYFYFKFYKDIKKNGFEDMRL